MAVDSEGAAQPDLAAVVAAARQGQAQAWQELIRRHERLVQSIARSYRLRDADAEDAVQNTWMRLVENLGRIREPERVAGWLATTAHREALAVLRRRLREGPLVELPDVYPDAAAGPEEAVLAGEAAAVLGQALAGLTERRRTLVRVLFLEQSPSYQHASRRTGLPLGSIGPTRARALAQLRECLDRRGYDVLPVSA